MSDRPDTIGIVGGMGPEATADLFLKIIRATPAKRDQDHIPVVIVSDPTVPDRTAAILGEGEDPLPVMSRSAEACIRAGADFLVMPCNTAHCFHPGLCTNIDVPVLHMMEEVTRYLREDHPEVGRVGLLATTGTVTLGLYQQSLEEGGVEVLVPSDEDQARVMDAIYGDKGVKAGYHDYARAVFAALAKTLREGGADAIIAGCTEIPLALSSEDVEPALLIDPTDILARAAVARALKRRGEKDDA